MQCQWSTQRIGLLAFIVMVLSVFVLYSTTGGVLVSTGTVLAEHDLGRVISRRPADRNSQLYNKANDRLYDQLEDNLESDEDDETEDEWMKKRQAERLSRMNEVCRAHPELVVNLTGNNRPLLYKYLRNLYFDTNNNVTFCFIPKAASHSVRAIVMNNTGRMVLSPKARFSPWKGGHLSNIGLFPVFSKNHSLADARDILNHTYNFLFPRHPLDRLVSAYSDKMFGHERPYSVTYANQVRTRYRGKQADSANTTLWESPVTFGEFVNFIFDSGLKPDWHWQTFQELCSPCMFPFDYVGRVETLEEDAAYLVKNHFPCSNQSDVVVPRMHRTKKRRGEFTTPVTSQPDSRFWRHLPEYSDLSNDEFGRVVKRYGVDMDMFGYQYKRNPLTGEVDVMCSQADC